MVSFSNSTLELLSIHNIGNKTNGDELTISKTVTDISDERLKDMLLRYFSNAFSTPEYYHFTSSNDDHTLNPLFKFADTIFNDTDAFHLNTVNIAKHLFETALHPQIKPGDLFVAYFPDVVIDEQITKAIGIFKSEEKDAFLKLGEDPKHMSLAYDDGISINKMDKGCLILNTDGDKGFRVCTIDRSGKSEALYWKDSFLKLKPASDEYHLTRNYLDVCKNFVTTQMEQEYEMNKTDKIDFLNKTVDYFKHNEAFDEHSFLNEVFEDKDVIKSFNKFKTAYVNESGIELEDSFEISGQAVKKQSRVFKSILKLDKNFHIYIHGDKELIEKGYDAGRGKHYYKIYFDEEA